MSKQKIAKENVNAAVFTFLRLKDSTYSLDLLLDKALEMGIFKEDYEDVVNGINKTNEYIKKAMQEPNHEVVLFDPAKKGVQILQLPSGTLTSSGQEQVGTGFFAPWGTSFVRFSCIGNAALTPAFICRTRALGDWKSKTEIGSSLFYTDIDVDLDASNYNVSITFQTTDSNGGVCNWQAMD